MNRISFYFSLIFLLLLNSTSADNAAKDNNKVGVLRVIITGISSDQGKIRIGLNNSREAYLSRGDMPSFRAGASEIKDRRSECVFKNLSFGDYTIKLYHDENSNDKVDTNFLGIPKEEYAFSNNVRGLFGLPSYEKAKFYLDSDYLTVEIAISR